MFNELLIKNDSIKTPPAFVFMEGFRLAHNHVLLLENKAFHHQVLTELCLNNNGKSNV